MGSTVLHSISVPDRSRKVPGILSGTRGNRFGESRQFICERRCHRWHRGNGKGAFRPSRQLVSCSLWYKPKRDRAWENVQSSRPGSHRGLLVVGRRSCFGNTNVWYVPPSCVETQTSNVNEGPGSHIFDERELPHHELEAMKEKNVTRLLARFMEPFT